MEGRIEGYISENFKRLLIMSRPGREEMLYAWLASEKPCRLMDESLRIRTCRGIVRC